MGKLAIYPGSFDPITNGHLDILQRALSIFDEVVVAVAVNINKPGLFSPEDRAALARSAIGDRAGVRIDVFSGLLIDYARRTGATSIVRGLRAMADFEYEFQLALMNRQLEPAVDTVFLMTDERHLYISSSLVKEIARFGGAVGAFVPAAVAAALGERFGGGAAE